MTVVESLKQFQVFSKIRQTALEKIGKTFERGIFFPDDVIIHKNERIRQIGLIVSGSAGVTARDSDPAGRIGKHDFYGVTDYFITGSGMADLICTAPMTCYIQNIRAFRKMIRQHHCIQNFFYQVALKSLWNAYRIRTHPMEETAVPPLPRSGRTASAMSENLATALSFIDDNYRTPISLDDVAQACHMSKYHFSRVFKAGLGISFKKYLNKKRIEAAKSLMHLPDMNMTDICFYVGFNDLSYFSRVFQKLEGVNPTVYKRTRLPVAGQKGAGPPDKLPPGTQPSIKRRIFYR